MADNTTTRLNLDNEPQPDADGMIRSSVFPGLRLNVPALLEGRMTDVLNGLQAGIADPMHQAFVQKLVGRSPNLE